ncbi:MAG TPA: hypothetical protein VGK19_21445 [Capsulimonadaceae bacterium]|jgi:hypothetical protein
MTRCRAHRKPHLVATTALTFALAVVAAPHSSAKPRPLPTLPHPQSAAPQLRIVPIPPAPPSSVVTVVDALGKQFQMPLVSFVPTYPVDMAKAGAALNARTAQDATAQLAAAVDGHVAMIGPVTAIVPNFRTDTPSAPLIPQVSAVVKASNGLAAAFSAIPQAVRPRSLEPAGMPFASLPTESIAAIDNLTVDSRPVADALFAGQRSANRAVSFKPELIVSVRYGTTRLGYFDLWEQRDSSAVQWEVDKPLERARRLWDNGATQSVAATLALPDVVYTVMNPKMTVAELGKVLVDTGLNVVVDHAIAPRTVAIAPGRYSAPNLYAAVKAAARLRLLPISDPSSQKTAFLLTGPSSTDDSALVHAAVDREIIRAWQPFIETLQFIGPVRPGAFNWEQFATFAMTPYPDLPLAQRTVIDRLLHTLPNQLRDDELARLTVTFRPAILAEGKLGDSSTGLTEQTATLFADTGQ